MISIDNGNTFWTAAEVADHWGEILPLWDAIVEAMDDSIREKVHAEGHETELDFLTAYLGYGDLVIG